MTKVLKLCAAYSSLVDAINREVPAGDYTINGEKFPDMDTDVGKNHYQMIDLHQKCPMNVEMCME